LVHLADLVLAAEQRELGPLLARLTLRQLHFARRRVLVVRIVLLRQAKRLALGIDETVLPRRQDEELSHLAASPRLAAGAVAPQPAVGVDGQWVRRVAVRQ